MKTTASISSKGFFNKKEECGIASTSSKVEQPLFFRNSMSNKSSNDSSISGGNNNGHTFFFKPKAFVRAKLTTNEPGDKYEREADQMADLVVQRLSEPDRHIDPPPLQNYSNPNSESPFMGYPSKILNFKPTPITSPFPLQTKCEACEAEEKTLQRKEDEEPIYLKPFHKFSLQRVCTSCEKEKKLQMKREKGVGGEMTTPTIVQDVINNGGQPLDTSTRGFMESRFGYDFSNVQIHNNSLAHQSSKEINALAYTHGNHVAFGSGQYQPSTDSGKKLLAHELTHVLQQRKNHGSEIHRQVVPAYRDCTNTITGIADSNNLLEDARLRAREFIGAATAALANAPVAGSVYATALNRHFITPTAADRATIAATYRQILNTLVVGNYICNSDNICEGEQAFYIAADDLIHICRPYWTLNRTCQAIILIHEGSHDIGIGIGAAHPPNRGSANYPAGNVAPPGGETTAARMNNPDAYAFFAAHIWRSTDTGLTCF